MGIETNFTNILQEFPLPWRVVKKETDHGPSVVEIISSNDASMLDGLYWEEEKGEELYNIFEYITYLANNYGDR